MSKRIYRRRSLHCSFCGKSQEEVRDMVAGPDVFICNECVSDAVRALAERAIKKAIEVVK